MFFSKRLKWSDIDDFGQREANDHPYRYIVWRGKDHAELRIIRRSNEGGIIVPTQDFSVYCSDLGAAIQMAEGVNRAFRKARQYNRFQTLF